MSGGQIYDRPLLGIGQKLLSTFMLATMVVLVKILIERIPIGEIIFARSFFGILPVIILAYWRGSIALIAKPSKKALLLIRGAVGAFALTLWFSALQYIPLAEAKAIGFFAPLAAVAMAYLFLNERVGIYRGAAVFVGFIGVSIVLSPNWATTSDHIFLGSMLALGAACAMALSTIIVRRLVHIEATETIVTWSALVASLVSLASISFGWVVPGIFDALLLVCTGLLGGLGQILLTQCYRHASIAVIAPFDYFAMIWVAGAGYFYFGEVPATTVILGALLICGAGIFVVQREAMLGIARRKERIINPVTRI